MTAQEQIAKLESLLDRIRRNASKPRAASASTASAIGAQPAPEPEARPLPQMAKPEPVAPVVSPPPPVAVVAAPAPQPAVAEEMDEAPEVSAAPAEIEDLDMMDVEIVEIAVAEAEETTVADEPPDTVDEPIPESAPRPAAALAPRELEPEPEAPIKTPPPESGRQAVANSSYEEPAREADLAGGNDVDSLLEADLSGAPISRAPAAGGPTMEQLGETVELVGADAPSANLELDSAPPVAKEAAPDELELELPKQTFSGGYEPPVAAAPAPVPQTPPPAPAAPPAPVVAAAAAPASPTIVERPHVDAIAAEVITASPPRLPETFLDLLDASLALKA